MSKFVTVSNEKMRSSAFCKNGDDPYILLVAGILKQAVDDLKKALVAEDEPEIKSLEQFFLSDWGQALSDGNGERIIRRVRNEARV